jgi:hypothetical protein
MRARARAGKDTISIRQETVEEETLKFKLWITGNEGAIKQTGATLTSL